MDALLGYITGWSWPALLCLIAGIILLIIEMFTPGFGISGAMGILALIAAVVLRADTFANAITTLLIILVLIMIAAFVFFKSASKGVISRSPLILKDSIKSGSTSLSDAEMQNLIGKEGISLNTLRPSGNANFDGLRLDVVSEGTYIPAGSRIKIIGIEGVKILVEKIQ